MEVDTKEETREAEMDEAVDGDVDDLPADASETVYVKNLNESVKVDVLRKTLESLFSLYGTVLSVKAAGNVRMRGQAFIAFDSKEPAAKAVKEVLGFPLYGKPMQLSFARTQSDAAVSKTGGDLEAFKAQRKEHKRRQRAQWRRRLLALKAGENEGQSGGAGAAATTTTDATTTTTSRRQEMQMPDEYLPPNRILFLHNVPDGVGRDDLESLFRSAHTGLLDVRLIPGRGVAFVEYTDAMQSSAARDTLNGHQFTPAGEKLRITFAK